MKKAIIFVSSILFSQLILAQVPTSFFSKADSFFKKNVVNGKVNYNAVKKNSNELDAILEIAAKAKPNKSNPNEFKAFYINMYNLSVIKGISESYPVNSPLKVNGLFKSKKFVVGGKGITLDAIENKILRPTYQKESRFHFTLVCAGLGCPPLISEAYTPDKLESQLQRQTVKAINNPNFIRTKGKKVYISKIFEWYAGDFKQFGSYVEYLNKYRKTPIDTSIKVSFYEYDWTLNDLK